MKVTQKQLHMLYQIAMESCRIVNLMPFTQDVREKLVNEILNQQDNEELVDFNK